VDQWDGAAHREGCCDASLAMLESTGKETLKPGLAMVTFAPEVERRRRNTAVDRTLTPAFAVNARALKPHDAAVQQDAGTLAVHCVLAKASLSRAQADILGDRIGVMARGQLRLIPAVTPTSNQIDAGFWACCRSFNPAHADGHPGRPHRHHGAWASACVPRKPGPPSACALSVPRLCEQADILGDRIGIMARGQLRAIGSSLRLKQRFGSGYQVRPTTTANSILVDK